MSSRSPVDTPMATTTAYCRRLYVCHPLYRVPCARVNVYMAITVPVPPVIEPRLQSEFVVKEGSTLRVLCEARGVPDPQIVWRRAGTNHSYRVDPLLSVLVRLSSSSLSGSRFGPPCIAVSVFRHVNAVDQASGRKGISTYFPCKLPFADAAL